MHSLITRTVSILLAFGLFIGCSTTSPSNIERDNLSQKELETELKKVNDSLADSKGQTSPELYYRKGYLLSELAEIEDNLSARSSVYAEMQNALHKAEQLFDSTEQIEGKQKVDELLKVKWSHEHNMGVQIIQSDSSTLRSNEYEQAAGYFNNATIILPDSAISYKLKARAYYRNHQLDNAISTLEKARQTILPLPSEILEQLAFLYLETDRAQQAVNVYEEAESFSDENLNLIHGLANAYISINDHQKAIELLDLLVEAEPENIIYAQTRGTELYFLGAAKIDNILSSQNPGAGVTFDTLQDILSLFDEAEGQFMDLHHANADTPELEHRIALFYKNGAAKFHRLIPYLSGDQADGLNRKVEEYLQSSIPLFESLTEKNPEEKALWRNLYQAYTYLGMNQKAREAQSKVNR